MADFQDDRAAILERLRQAATPGDDAPLSPASALPPPSGDLLAAFLQSAAKNSAETIVIAALEELPSAVADYLREKEQPPVIVCEESLSALAWQDAGIKAESRAAADADTCGVTRAPVAAADSGAMLHTDAVENALTVSLLPPYHVVVVNAADVVADMATLLTRLPAPLPRNCCLLCGPSRTADIEQTLTLGVHGPVAVLVVVVQDSPAPDVAV